MPGPLLHVGATVLCTHGGQAQPTVPNPRVTVTGQPVVTLPGPYVVAGCTFPPPPNGNGPCVSGQWTTAATRILVGGAAVLLFDSTATCVPTGTPLQVAQSQIRVTGT